ncbi:hypothetical protein LO772_12880 [Yinghuangia sp. ASG 101]|uniref:hypothetical protein n=1 Tax=Yinghuangia sp. ASG 101 TaxID=2896848 RepID=UPI001E354F35|nr:hypothetical protein [Yinghuangia sp. ASG 101]UGQ14397.1 hypothetical protein LO772_12880 [Yinghuangia sp. ASG 101]
MRIRRIAVAASGAVLAALTLGACGDDEEKDNTKTEASKLADEAVAAMNKLEFVNNNGTSTDEDGKTATIKACAVMKTKAVKGTQEADGEKAEVISIEGFQYVKASAKYWAEVSGRPSRESLYRQVIGDKWFKMADDGDDDLEFFGGATGGVTKGEVTDFHGKQAVPLSMTKDGAKKTYFVAAKGEPLIIGQIEEGPEPKERTETELSKADKCDVAAPPADQTITEDEVNDKAAELQGA